MGREMIFEVRDNNKPIWPDPNDIDAALYVCGRDDATTFLASYVNNHLPEDQDDDTEPVVLLRVDDKDLTYLKERLQEFLDKDNREIQKAKNTLEDLREARRHTTTLDDFRDFSEAIEDTEQWLEEEGGWSRAGSMLEGLNYCIEKALDYINADNNPDRESVIDRYRVAIIWSE